MSLIAWCLGALLATAVWIGLVRWRLRYPLRGGRTRHALLVALALIPAIGIIGLGGVGVIAFSQCEFLEPSDCSASYRPIVAVWVTICLCLYAAAVHGAYTSRGRR